MKKLYTLSLVLFACAASFAQTFYSENLGTTAVSSPYPLATAYTGYQNAAPIVYAGTADVRGTLISAGYAGASAGNNVFITNVVGKYFQISGINSSPYASADLQLSFGINTPGNTADGFQLIVEASTNGTTWTPITYDFPGTGWKLVTVAGGQIPSSATLSLRFSQPDPVVGQFRIDDVKLTSVNAACPLTLNPETTLCDAFTMNMDTYTATIPFTGGGTATYGITATSGTIGGDNPSTVEAGNIIITGITEGTGITVGVTGGSCTLNRTIIAPDCKAISPLPYSENFVYNAGTNLSAGQGWADLNSGDAVVVADDNLTYPGVFSNGKSASFTGTGAECYAKITPVTSGTFYTSFLMKVTDFATTVDEAQAYFATLTGVQTGSDFKVRVFIKKNGTQYNIGATNATSASAGIYGPTAYNVGDVVYVVIGYDFTANELKLWLNPNASTFTAATPATITETPASTITTINAFLLRQQDVDNTPAITIDALRMATTTAELLSVSQNAISGLKVYPNPVTNGTLYIDTNANAEKAVVIFDVLGKEVVNTKTSTNAVNVSNLKGGVYIVKITEEGKTATRKLVIR